MGAAMVGCPVGRESDAGLEAVEEVWDFSRRRRVDTETQSVRESDD